MSDERKLWVVPFSIQQEQISAWCWGKGCGKGLIGVIDLGMYTAVPCREAECPYLDREMDEPMGEDSDGVPVYLRKLREMDGG